MARRLWWETETETRPGLLTGPLTSPYFPPLLTQSSKALPYLQCKLQNLCHCATLKHYTSHKGLVELARCSAYWPDFSSSYAKMPHGNECHVITEQVNWKLKNGNSPSFNVAFACAHSLSLVTWTKENKFAGYIQWGKGKIPPTLCYYSYYMTKL